VVRVSVIIPVYNRPELGERAVRSAIAQRVEGMEIVVVDDCSNPPFRLAPDIAENPNIRLVRNETNGGESVARNNGVAAAKGSWIAFLDSDDYWLVDTLRPRLELAEREFSAENYAMTTYVAGFVTDNKRTGLRQARIPRESARTVDFASGCWFAPGSTMLCRKEAMQRVGPSDPGLRRLQDLDWFLRFALAGGKIRVWAKIAAVIETGPKPPVPTLEESVRHLQAKYSDRSNPCCLPPELMRRLEAYIDVERASLFGAQRRWLQTAYYLGRSVWRVPRLSLSLERFWRYAPLPPGLEPAGAPPIAKARTQ
jgi:glycosyltransferase involved in cell wall biosynthesis